jgi:hypothetical protein
MNRKDKGFLRFPGNRPRTPNKEIPTPTHLFFLQSIENKYVTIPSIFKLFKINKLFF